ncbi:hypothetical protein E1B28_005583 [Marasmius oreades]|uniref:Uncharacterized protein n=1 Tax=Marasmius oreades TaxID=181124 RepID=A0A9P7S3S2_9AGAR|nr:uncharacterized protein E1B28_005583 [Marasmius oreades]KAG7094767.1 hypothetical protein E1B28_005583 [Marasmius oreades]
MSDNKFKLTAYISDESLTILKQGGYKLCIAREVNGKYNVVFISVIEHLFQNVFEFEEQYRVFGTKKFEAGALIEASTRRRVPIMPGQEIPLSLEGGFGSVTGYVDRSKPFMVNSNYYHPIHFGVDALVSQDYAAIHVSEGPYVAQAVPLKPSRKIMIWFDKELESGMMIYHTVYNCMHVSSALLIPHPPSPKSVAQVDFTNTSDVTINYAAPKDAPAKGVWSYGALPMMVVGQTYDPRTNRFYVTPEDLPSADMFVKMAELLHLDPPTHHGSAGEVHAHK